jgi:hypothetical protein
MKHFVGVGTLVALALIVRLGVFQSIGLDIHLHDTYRVIPLRAVGFWVLIGIAAAWSLIAAYKFRRHKAWRGGEAQTIGSDVRCWLCGNVVRCELWPAKI